MTAKDAFAAHLRDELGLSEHVAARPIEAALTSAVTFSAGAALPLLTAVAAPAEWTATAVSGGALAGLAILGTLGAKVGGASVLKPTVRVTFSGAVAMAATAVIGSLLGRAEGCPSPRSGMCQSLRAIGYLRQPDEGRARCGGRSFNRR